MPAAEWRGMKVYKVEDGMDVQPNCVYIIPPNRDMAFLGGRGIRNRQMGASTFQEVRDGQEERRHTRCD